MRRVVWTIIGETFAGAFVGLAFGFMLIGGLWARVAVDEARIEQAEARQAEMRMQIEACVAGARETQDTLTRLKRLVRGVAGGD